MTLTAMRARLGLSLEGHIAQLEAALMGWVRRRVGAGSKSAIRFDTGRNPLASHVGKIIPLLKSIKMAANERQVPERTQEDAGKALEGR
jgi:hypothetical protein